MAARRHDRCCPPARAGVLLVAAVLLGGCPKRPAEPRVVGVRVVGSSEPLTRSQVWEARQVVSQQPSGWWHRLLPPTALVWPRPLLDPKVLGHDVTRLEEHFADLGYLDAEVDVRVEPSRGRSRFRDVVFEVEPGPRFSVADVQLLLDPVDGTSTVGLDHEVRLAPGPFDGTAQKQVIRELVSELHQRGHARAGVERAVVRHPGTDQVTVRLDVEPGPLCTFGPVRLEGLERARAERVEALARVPQGAPFDPTVIRRARRRLDRFGAFDAMAVTLGGREAGARVPVVVQLHEHRVLSSRPVLYVGGDGWFGGVGVGAGFERRWPRWGRAAVRGSGVVGYRASAFVPFGQPHAHGPLVEVLLDGELPVFPAQGVSAFVGGTLHTDVQHAYHSVNAGSKAGLRWAPDPRFRVQVATSLDQWTYYPYPDQRESFDVAFAGPDALVPSSLSLGVATRVDLDLRDDVDNPSRGGLLTVEAVPHARTEGTSWSRVEGDARGYLPLIGSLRLATRVRAGLADADALPFLHSRFFLGGATVRGWGHQRLGPPGFAGDAFAVHTGGRVMLSGSVEARVRVHRDVWAQAFIDVGRVWEGGIHLDDLQPSAGGGIRVPSPLGPIRAEVGVRLRRETGLVEPVAPLIVHLSLRPWF